MLSADLTEIDINNNFPNNEGLSSALVSRGRSPLLNSIVFLQLSVGLPSDSPRV